MIALASLTLLVAPAAASTVYRWICPDTAGGSPLQEENLINFGGCDCAWYGGGLPYRTASFDEASALVYKEPF